MDLTFGAERSHKKLRSVKVLKGDHQTAASVSDPANISIKFEKPPAIKGMDRQLQMYTQS